MNMTKLFVGQALSPATKPGIWLIAGVLVALATPTVSAQWSGRKDEAVIYVISKAKSDLQLAPAGAVNGAVTGLQLTSLSAVPKTPFGPDFPAKQLQVLHNEPADRFAFMTDLENVDTPRYQNTLSSKILTLSGLLRDDNPGSVSTEPFDATGALYVPYFPGIAQGPGRAIELFTSLIWTPSSTTPPYVKVPDGTISAFGVAGATGIELEGLSGVAAFFAPWINLQKYYPRQAWPLGVDIKVLDYDPSVGNSAYLIRFRPAAATPVFSFTANTHVFVLQGNAVVQTAGAAPQPFNLNTYAFVPAGYYLSISNPQPYTGPGATP